MKVDFEIKDDKCIFKALDLDRVEVTKKLAPIVKTVLDNKLNASQMLKLAVILLSEKEILAVAGLTLVDATNKAINNKATSKVVRDVRESLEKFAEVKIGKVPVEMPKPKVEIKEMQAGSFFDFMEMLVGDKGDCPCPDCAVEREASVGMKPSHGDAAE